MLPAKWPSCIVTAIDVVGTKEIAATGRGSSLMISMRAFAVNMINEGLPMHSHGYVWNDSILLLSHETKDASTRMRLLEELSTFKAALERACGARTYGISVKGQSFPEPQLQSPQGIGGMEDRSRAIVLKTSSWAMANCFLIEKKLGHYSADWYIDSRITRGAEIDEPFACVSVELLPKKRLRDIMMYKGELRPRRSIGPG